MGTAFSSLLGSPHPIVALPCPMALIQYLTQIQFDFGAVRLLADECLRIGITRPLVVTDKGVRAAGILQKALDALGDLESTVFDDTPSNPTEAAVRAAAGDSALVV